jgi:hypothetical protein
MNMNTFKRSFFWRVLIEQRGQVLPWVAISMVAFLGVGGISFDLGHAYIVRSQLQGAANAAALAAVTDLYTTVNTVSAASQTLTSDANKYSASTGGANTIAGLGTVTTTVTTPCINALMPTTTCSASGNIPNAVRVQETASVPTYFMKIVGISTVQVGATATAAPKGTNPWNIAVILDTTSSMVNQDTKCTGKTTVTAEQCAMNGIETLLTKIKPCIAGTSCGPLDANTWVRVSLFAFPNVSQTTVANDYALNGAACSGTQPTGMQYTLPNVPPSTGTSATDGYTPLKYTAKAGGAGNVEVETSTYQITPPSVGNADAHGFVSDFYPGTKTQQLNPNSILVQAIGNSPVSGTSLTTGCVKPILGATWGKGVSGGYGQETYFASAIYAAQAALQAEKAAVDPLLIASGVASKNAIIFVSDGQANTYSSNSFPPATSYAYSASGEGGLDVTYAGTSTYSAKAKNLTGTASAWGTYPDITNPCQQAIVAAQYAKTAGTRVFGVAYGSESGRCPADSRVVLTAAQKTALNKTISAIGDVTPCATVENIAGSMQDFYADSSSLGCTPTTTNAPMDSIAAIFEAIASKLGPGGYLIPNSLT